MSKKADTYFMVIDNHGDYVSTPLDVTAKNKRELFEFHLPMVEVEINPVGKHPDTVRVKELLEKNRELRNDLDCYEL